MAQKETFFFGFVFFSSERREAERLEAERLLQGALRIQATVLPPGHETTQMTMDLLEIVS